MLPGLTSRVMKGENLSAAESEQALEWILAEDTPDAAIASFLTALSIKGESEDEIAGFARTMRRHAVSIRSRHDQLADTAGTGGGTATFNISTAAAFVIAGAGLPVAKHGNRALTSRSGSADVLNELGVPMDRPPELSEKALNEIGVAFLFAPLFHPAMKRVALIRRQLGHRTVFNLLGPLTNPAGATLQIVGVYSADLTRKVAGALSRLGCRRAWVVHSHDGMDELSCSARSSVSEVAGNQVRSFEFDPREAGFLPETGRISDAALRGGDSPQEMRGAAGDSTHPGAGSPAESARLLLSILEGREMGQPRDQVVLNAAAVLHVAGEEDFPTALERARQSIDSGEARRKLRELVHFYSEV